MPRKALKRKPRERKAVGTFEAGTFDLGPPLRGAGLNPDTATHDGQESVKAIISQWRRERPDLDFEPMSLFASLARGYFLTSSRIDRLVAQYGLTRGMFDVLATLRRAGPPYCLTPKQLSASLLLSGAGMTSRLDRLEALKFVARVPEPSDRRSLQIKMTKRGVDLVNRILPELLEAQRASFAFGVENARELTKLLGMMNEKLHPE
ncbi:MAG TPA: MarR family transcriptional regulator [Bradyrhizobium sp.]|nr:MarR family transcriptional regulator [Bradyrhizobium sp.]